MKVIVLSLIILCFTFLGNVQGQQGIDLPGIRSVNDIRNSQYPRILPDNRAIIKVKAPEAQKIQADVLGHIYDMQKDVNGEWTCTTNPLGPGFHYYFLLIDGVSVLDPGSEAFYGCGKIAGGLEIPYPDGGERFALKKDIPRGEVRMRRYFSQTAGAWRKMYVYTPPCYENSNEEYPVLYLLHGGGEDERGWHQQGLTDIVLDNLIAMGKANPMVIVMPDGNSLDFESELLNTCIPVVESTYRVKEDRENRALAGLSMGGIQTLNIGIEHPDLFAYLGVFSSGWWATPPNGMQNTVDTEKYYELLKNKKDYYNKAFKQFWISMGGKEDIAYNNCQIMMKRFDEIGIKYTYFDTPGGHTWPVWRESIYKFASLIFK
ncbi:MAG: alpha/beta hydrolase-fold protein [Dysgonomonas sp.]|uniref:alpha/beta hydrolase-fold protein n=1 Tax=Dysgonomonas sp. TaxID=1891233 RepID=UPI0039E39222